MAGKTWDFVDQDVLGSDEFSDVRQVLSPLADLWKNLATELGLPTSSVREVGLECRNVPARCLDLVIEKWLNQDYPYSKCGLPSWRKLVMAVDSRVGGRYPKLAREIAEKHPLHKHKVSSLLQAHKDTLDNKPVTVSSIIQMRESVIKDATGEKIATLRPSIPQHELFGTSMMGKKLATVSSAVLVDEHVVEGSMPITCKSVSPPPRIQDTEMINVTKSGNIPDVLSFIAQNLEPLVEGTMVDKPSAAQVLPPVQQHKEPSVAEVGDKPATALPTSQINESFGEGTSEGTEVDKQVNVPISNDVHQSLTSQKHATFLVQQHEEPSVAAVDDKPATIIESFGEGTGEDILVDVDKQVNLLIDNDVHQSLSQNRATFPVQQHEEPSVAAVDDKHATVMPTSQIHESFGESAGKDIDVDKQVNVPIGNDVHQSLSQKRATFMYEPIGDKPVTVLDGVGDKLCERLARKGFDKAYTVLGQFLLLKKDRELFMEWLGGTFDAELQEQLKCYDCLKEWCDIFI